MNPRVRALARGALWALPVWAALLFYGTLTHQPDPQTDFAAFAAYVTTPEFLLSHLVASIAGAAIGSVGVVGLVLYLQDTRVMGRAFTGMVATVAGNTFVSAIFGVAAFAQTAMGRMFQAGQPNMVDFYNQVYDNTLFITAAIALLLFVLGGVFTGLAIAGSGRLPRWAGWLYLVAAIGFVLSTFLLDIGQSISSALLFVAAAAVAWRAGQADKALEGKADIAAGTVSG